MTVFRPQEPSEAVVPAWPQSAIDLFSEKAIVFANGKSHQTVKRSLTPVFLNRSRLRFLHPYVQVRFAGTSRPALLE